MTDIYPTVVDLAGICRQAEIRLADACDVGEDLPQYLAALRLFGAPILEGVCDRTEMEFARKLTAEALERAEWAVRRLRELDESLKALEVAAIEGTTW